jgi:hypothetical protein
MDYGVWWILVMCFCEHYNEPSDFIECGNFVDLLSDCQLLKNPAPCSLITHKI